VLIDTRRRAGRQVALVIPIGSLALYDRPAPAWTPMRSCWPGPVHDGRVW